MTKEWYQMLKIHKQTEQRIKNEQWYFYNPDKKWMRIDKPKIMNVLFAKYKSTTPIGSL